MSAEILLLLLIAAVLVFILRLRQRLALLAAQIRALRTHALEPVTYREVSVDAAVAQALDTATHEAEALGLVMVGDYVEETSVPTDERPMRWFVDKAGTTFGWMAPFSADGTEHVVVVLMSHELDRQTITARQPPSSMLTRPPFVSLQQVVVDTTIEDTLARHRDHAGLADADRSFVPVHSFDEVRHEVARMRDKVIAWRKQQPADELLEADLRSLLGAQYDRLAGPLRRRLR